MSERMDEPRDPAPGPDPWADGPPRSESPADPWVDAPAWSDGSTGPDPAGEVAAASGTPAAQTDSVDGPATCPWCATPAAADAARCASCGAALAQRESIGDLVIPGLTAVDPALKDLAERPLHLSGPSPTHGVASGVIAAAALGGPVGLVIVGGVGAVAATEYFGANRTSREAPGGDVGQASAAVLQAVEKLERGEDLPTADTSSAAPPTEAPANESSSTPRKDQEEEPYGG